MNSAVIDANVAVSAVMPGRHHAAAVNLLERLVIEEAPIYVPHLWLSEVTTVIRKIASLASISRESALQALRAALALPVMVIAEDADLCLQAYAWAERIEHLAAYDALYLALAERLDTDFYTADEKLFNRCQRIRAKFVQLLE